MPFCPSCTAWQDDDWTRCAHCGRVGWPDRTRDEDGIPRLGSVDPTPVRRWKTSCPGLDAALGGGLPQMARTMIYGPPGIGKSRLMLKVAGHLARSVPVLYAPLEESAGVIGTRAGQFGIAPDVDLSLCEDPDMDAILDQAERHRSRLVCVDSIQYAAHGDPAAGELVRVVRAARRLMAWSQATGVGVWFTAHETKDHGAAGPHSVKHGIDIELRYLGAPEGNLRALKPMKIRFGGSGKLCYFEDSDAGPQDVTGRAASIAFRRNDPSQPVAFKRDG